MDSAFDDMFNILEGDDTEAIEAIDKLEDNIELYFADYDTETLHMTELVKNMEVPPIAEIARPVPVEIREFDPDNNVLHFAQREKFKNGVIFENSAIFTDPISTTNTMGGFLSNVKFHENELIHELIPDDHFVLAKCNYDKIIYEGYREPVKVKKTNRGRKKKLKVKKKRKVQGNGTDFNSQITFFIRSMADTRSDPVPADAKIYKFKAFRTGTIQLPGVHQHCIDDIIECVRKLVEVLNFHFHPGETDRSKMTNIVNINPVMKNYKFVIKMPPMHILDLDAFNKLILKERSAAHPDKPKILAPVYNREASKLAIIFKTPIYRKPVKMTRVNIFMRGKVNILGAFDVDITAQICNYLGDLLLTHYDELIVMEGGFINIKLVNNILPLDPLDEKKIVHSVVNWLPDLPPLTDMEVEGIFSMIDAVFDDHMRDFNETLERILG